MVVDIFSTTNKYQTIYADPPWWETGGGKIKRGADRHYSLMKTSEIMGLPVKRIVNSDGCHCYLWATNNHLKDAFQVLEAWGFQYVTLITWQKDKAGLGQYFRGMTEHCLFGTTKAKLPYKIIDGKRQQGVTGFLESRREHSKKPEKMRQMIETVSYGPMIELFAREERNGWDAWGIDVQGGVMPILLCLEEREGKFMNYEKLWNGFKGYLAKESKNMERGGQYISVHKELLAYMGIMEASEYERVSAGCGEHPEPDKNAGRKEPEEKPDRNQGADRKPEPGEILKKVFGGEYAGSLKELEKKMMGRTGGIIFVDPEVEFTDEILNDAKARGITLAHASVQEIHIGSSGSPIPPYPFLNGGRFA